MGSAQSARRIQPGGVVRPCRRPRRIFPAPRSSRPLHPSFLPRRPSVSLLSPFPLRGRGRGERGAPAGAWGGGRGRGWGRRGTAPRPATGRRRAHFHRGGAPRPAPGRLGRPGGEGGSGGPRSAVSAPLRVCVCVCLSLSSGGRGARARARGGSGAAPGAQPPRVLQPPGSSARRIPGPREPDPSPRSPPSRRSPPRGLPSFFPPREGGEGGFHPRGGAPVSFGGAGPPLPRRDRSPTPPAPGDGARGGAGRTVLSAPRAKSRRRARGVLQGATPRSEASARGRRRCRPPTRPVL